MSSLVSLDEGVDMRVIGMISGTSYDAVELAAAEFRLEDDTVVLHPLGTSTSELPRPLRDRIAAVLPPAGTTVGEVCRLDTELGQLFGTAARQAAVELTAGTAGLVVSHGQTVFHWVEDRRARGTLQLGSPAWIAEACGLPVLSDLRTRDIARGGQGAPLVSLLDALLILGDERGRGALNLGGIANITVRRDGEVLAWDLGPANALLDAAAVDVSGGAESMDVDGARARRGRVRQDLLAALLDEPYYDLPAPKSTGKELFHASYLRNRVTRVTTAGGPPTAPDDLLATVTELTAVVVAGTCRAEELTELVVSGGGVRNPALMARLRERCAPTTVSTVDAYGLPVTGKEAYAMALLGYLATLGLPGTIPSATGASAPSVVGSFTPGAAPLRLPEPAARAPHRLRVEP